jgi:hypothetical protein
VSDHRDPVTKAALAASRYMTWAGVGELILAVVVMLLMKSQHNRLWYVYGIVLILGGCIILGYGQFMRRRIARIP